MKPTTLWAHNFFHFTFKLKVIEGQLVVFEKNI